MTAMRTFIEDYLADPAQAVADARLQAYRRFWDDDFNPEDIYKEIASPEFHLYQEMVLCETEEDSPHVSSFVSVA